VPPTIIADRQRLSQVINNLLSNAVKFTSKGSISLKISVQENGANNFADSDEIYLKTEVIDSGVGINPEIKEKLFLPFYQIEHELTGKFDGTGLGLAISRELVRLMGGEIEVESKVGKGSKFWFSFKAQVKKQIADTDDDSETITEIKSGKPLKILLVEDKDVNQKVIGLLLKSLSHKVVVAANGEDALRQYAPGKFDLILMDIKMPVMDGITATRKLKELYPGVPPIIGLSASSFEGDREKYMKEGLDEYLTKPLDTEAFITLMQKLDLH
jgi:CheY-like chemotaxis protein